MENENENVFDKQLINGFETTTIGSETITTEEFEKVHEKVNEMKNNLENQPESEEPVHREGEREKYEDGRKYFFNDEDNTTVRDLTKEESILNDLKKKKENSKTFSEEELRETLLNWEFVNDVMSKFNSMINEEAKDFLEATKKAEEWEDDEDSPTVFIKLIPSGERDRILFKEMLLSTSEKRIPIYIDIGDYDFFFDYFDDDHNPIFSFNRKSFMFFFNNDVVKLKEYIKENKCAFAFDGHTKYLLSNERQIKFDDLIVEIIEKKKGEKTVKDDIVKETVNDDNVKETVNSDDTVKEKNTIKMENFSTIKKVYRVKFHVIEPLIITTDNPAKIYENFGDSILSVKVIGDGISI
jgi:hypothetical protein